MSNIGQIIFLLVFSWLVFCVACVRAIHIERRIPADDIGLFWLAVLTFYSTFPPFIWLLQGQQSLTGRLLYLQPSGAEVLYLLHVSLAYALSFVAVYAPLRGYVPYFRREAFTPISDATMRSALVLVASAFLVPLFFKFSGMLRGSETYIDQYRAIQELSVPARQLLRVSSGIGSIAQWVLLAAIMQRWPQERLLAALYASSVLFSFDPDGSRAALAINLLAILVAWHTLVRPVAAPVWFTIGLFGVVTFIALGIRRATGSWTDVGLASLGSTEFEELWANGVHLLRASKAGLTAIPFEARFAELWAFIPSQLLPFEKMALSDWYVRTFFPSYHEQGGGFVFGAVAQAVIGDGIIEAVVRGAILGGITVLLMRWYRTPGKRWWRVPIYLYFYAFSFQTVRDTTFRLIADFVQIVIPGIALLAVLSLLFIQRDLAGPKKA